jgi:hypothetical protein
MKIVLSSAGVVSLTPATGDLITIDYELHSYLGDGVAVEVALSLATGATAPTPANTIAQLTWRDTATDKIIYRVSGIVGLPIDNPKSLRSVADATDQFSSIEVTTVATGFAAAVTGSDAYNAPNSLGRNKVSLALPDDQPPAFNADALYDAITLMEPKPSYLVLPDADDLVVMETMQRVMQTLNVPLLVELDPTLTIDQAASQITAIDAQDHRVVAIWNPTLSRPATATSLRGAKKTRRAVGQLVGKMLLRNARVNSQGIPPIDTPVAGHDFPFTFNSMEMRPDVVLNNAALEKLATAKINVLRRLKFDTGVRFVLSDVLTQHQSENSALRLINSMEIICFTTNVVLEILKRHMLKKTTGFLVDADRDIGNFLSACAAAGLLQPADDLGGQPFTYALTADPTAPFERVRLVMQRRPEGAVRSVIFDEDVVVK